MATKFTYPGVYLEEIESSVRPIVGVDISGPRSSGTHRAQIAGGPLQEPEVHDRTHRSSGRSFLAVPRPTPS